MFVDDKTLVISRFWNHSDVCQKDIKRKCLSSNCFYFLNVIYMCQQLSNAQTTLLNVAKHSIALNEHWDNGSVSHLCVWLGLNNAYSVRSKHWFHFTHTLQRAHHLNGCLYRVEKSFSGNAAVYTNANRAIVDSVPRHEPQQVVLVQCNWMFCYVQ